MIKIQRTTPMLVLFFMGLVTITAQTPENLLGKWRTTYRGEDQKIKTVYEFRKEDGKINAYSIMIKDDEGNSMEDNTLVLDKVTLSDEIGSARYNIELNGHRFDVTARLKLRDEDSLAVIYSFWGAPNLEIWKRVED